MTVTVTIIGFEELREALQELYDVALESVEMNEGEWPEARAAIQKAGDALRAGYKKYD